MLDVIGVLFDGGTGRWKTKRGNKWNSLVIYDESRHTKFPFPFVVPSWGELWLICPELLLILP